MRIIDHADLPPALYQRAADARAAETRQALARLAVAPPGATPPAAPGADVVQLSPEARAAWQHLRQPPDLAALAALLRDALPGPGSPPGPAFAALRAALAALGVEPAAIPATPAALGALVSALRAAFPALAGDDAAAASLAAWLLAGRAGPGFELPPALLSLLVPPEQRRRSRPAARREPAARVDSASQKFVQSARTSPTGGRAWT
ncbi:hypothetical protein [Tepidiforma bonchosmolovskayae]|nr:hypothetical protein [Tepidiforma bonchosmolovskayae]